MFTVKVYVSDLHRHVWEVAKYLIIRVAKIFTPPFFWSEVCRVLARRGNHILSRIGVGKKFCSGWLELSPNTLAQDLRKQGVRVETLDLLHFAKSVQSFYQCS